MLQLPLEAISNLFVSHSQKSIKGQTNPGGEETMQKTPKSAVDFLGFDLQATQTVPFKNTHE